MNYVTEHRKAGLNVLVSSCFALLNQHMKFLYISATSGIFKSQILLLVALTGYSGIQMINDAFFL
jgi:hypothetical protein